MARKHVRYEASSVVNGGGMSKAGMGQRKVGSGEDGRLVEIAGGGGGVHVNRTVETSI